MRNTEADDGEEGEMEGAAKGEDAAEPQPLKPPTVPLPTAKELEAVAAAAEQRGHHVVASLLRKRQLAARRL